MSNYPDDFRGTPYDAKRCAQCGHWDYTNDDGICSECEWRQQKNESARHRAYHHLVDIANVKVAQALGWIL